MPGSAASTRQSEQVTWLLPYRLHGHAHCRRTEGDRASVRGPAALLPCPASIALRWAGAAAARGRRAVPAVPSLARRARSRRTAHANRKHVSGQHKQRLGGWMSAALPAWRGEPAGHVEVRLPRASATAASRRRFLRRRASASLASAARRDRTRRRLIPRPRAAQCAKSARACVKQQQAAVLAETCARSPEGDGSPRVERVRAPRARGNNTPDDVADRVLVTTRTEVEISRKPAAVRRPQDS